MSAPSNPTETTSEAAPSRRERRFVLGVCSMSLLIVGMDATIVNVALPAIGRSLHSGLAGLQWTIDAYTLVLASLLMLAGSTADRLGRRRVFQAGLIVFSAGSLACALAPSLGLLITFRVLQAVGGAMLSPATMSIIRNTLSDPAERARAIVILLAIAVGSLIAFVLYELRRDEPLLEMRFFTSIPFAGASVIAICVLASFGGFLFLSTLYLQDVRDLSPLHTGLYLLPTAGAMAVIAPLSGRLTARYGARPSILVGGAAVLASGLMLTTLTADTSMLFLLAAFAIFGLGVALVNPPITNTAVTGMPPAQAGVASAVATTSRQVGMALGVAVLGVIAGAGVDSKIGPGFAYATHAAWWVVAALGFAVIALGYVTTTGWAHRTAERSRSCC